MRKWILCLAFLFGIQSVSFGQTYKTFNVCRFQPSFYKCWKYDIQRTLNITDFLLIAGLKRPELMPAVPMEGVMNFDKAVEELKKSSNGSYICCAYQPSLRVFYEGEELKAQIDGVTHSVVDKTTLRSFDGWFVVD